MSSGKAMKKRGQHRKFFSSLPAWVGIVAITLQVNAVPLDYALFRLNQGHIARTQCEHKTPHCDGHCFLAKQIAKTGNATNDKRTERSAQLDGQFLCSPENNLTLFPSSLTGQMFAIRNIAPGWHSALLQPPRSA